MNYLQNAQTKLSDVLEAKGIKPSIIKTILSSGYFYTEASLYGLGDRTLCVSDSFYGSKWLMGLIPIDTFCSSELPQIAPPEYTIASVDDAERLLRDDRHARFHESASLSLRGQTQEYFAQRPYPNPVVARNGKKRLVIPSFWRQFHKDWNKRFGKRPPASIFTTIYGDDLIYHGIPRTGSRYPGET